MLQNIAEKIDETIKPLRLRGVLKKRTETLEEFLTKFFTEWNHEKTTIYTGNGHVQTPPGKRRSVGDIYKICQYYYPKCTLQEVKDVLYTKLSKSVPRFRSSYCNQIHKRVFYQGDESQESEFYDTKKHDEYGLTPAAWKRLKE